MAKLYTFGDYIFSRENKVQTFILGFHSLSELRVVFWGQKVTESWGGYIESPSNIGSGYM